MFAEKILPLLDGNSDRNEVAAAVSEELRPSVFAFLDLLEQQGLLETVLDEVEDPLQMQWANQERFFRAWLKQPGKSNASAARSKRPGRR